MRCATKVVVTLLALVGLTGVACRLFVSKETLRNVRAAIHAKLGHRHHHRHHHYNHGMQAEEMEAMTCHERCGDDDKCHKGCPSPWKFMEEKCEEVGHIVGCHRACGCNHTCHLKCPLPRCPRMQVLANSSLKCHGECASGDGACHRACPKPFLRMSQQCRALQCHKDCGVGHSDCRRMCPELMMFSHYDLDEHHGHRHGHYGYHYHHDHHFLHDHDHHDHHDHHDGSHDHHDGHDDHHDHHGVHPFQDHDHHDHHGHHDHHDHHDHDHTDKAEWDVHHERNKAQWEALQKKHHHDHHDHGHDGDEKAQWGARRDHDEVFEKVWVEEAQPKCPFARLLQRMKTAVPWDWVQRHYIQV